LAHEQRSFVLYPAVSLVSIRPEGPYPERILSMLQVNVVALTELTRLVLPQMVARKRGKVMLLASLRGPRSLGPWLQT
jgi:NAD(P)-dependent dehydrogenase (short-subunit alcohol dehydrogenase family)